MRWPGTAHALLAVLDGREAWPRRSTRPAALLATVLGQDLDRDEAGVFRIARRVAKDRVISTVDPEARHGHKTAARGFDGYKGHVGIDPDSEIITATAVTAGNAGDAGGAEDTDRRPARRAHHHHRTPRATAGVEDGTTAGTDGAIAASLPSRVSPSPRCTPRPSLLRRTPPSIRQRGQGGVYGDNAYGTGEFQDRLDRAGIESRCKTQPAGRPAGVFAKDRFGIDLDADTVRCPAGHTAPIIARPQRRRHRRFGAGCAGCPLRAAVHHRPGRTHRQRRRPRGGNSPRPGPGNSDPDWIADYRATRPKVERKIGHLMRRTPRRAPRPRPRHRPRSPPTSRCSPPPSTSPGWPCSACQRPRIRMGRRGPDEPDRTLKAPTQQPKRPTRRHRRTTSGGHRSAPSHEKCAHPRQRSRAHRRCSTSRPPTAV